MVASLAVNGLMVARSMKPSPNDFAPSNWFQSNTSTEKDDVTRDGWYDRCEIETKHAKLKRTYHLCNEILVPNRGERFLDRLRLEDLLAVQSENHKGVGFPLRCCVSRKCDSDCCKLTTSIRAMKILAIDQVDAERSHVYSRSSDRGCGQEDMNLLRMLSRGSRLIGTGTYFAEIVTRPANLSSSLVSVNSSSFNFNHRKER